MHQWMDAPMDIQIFHFKRLLILRFESTFLKKNFFSNMEKSMCDECHQYLIPNGGIHGENTFVDDGVDGVNMRNKKKVVHGFT